MSGEMRKELILNASQDIVDWLDEKYCIDVDIYDIAEFIDTNLGFVFTKAEESYKK